MRICTAGSYNIYVASIRECVLLSLLYQLQPTISGIISYTVTLHSLYHFAEDLYCRCNSIYGPGLDRINSFSFDSTYNQVKKLALYITLCSLRSFFLYNYRLFEPEMPDLEHVTVPERCQLCGALKSAASSSSKSPATGSGHSHGERSRARSSSNCYDVCHCDTGLLHSHHHSILLVLFIIMLN